MSLFRQLLIAKSQEKKKPYYCEVEYLESSGAQYIDTDIKPIISDTVKPVIKLVHQFNTLETCRILGATDNYKYFQFFNNATGSDGFGIQLFNTDGHYSKFTLNTDKHVYEINTVSNIAKQDDTVQSLSFDKGSLDYNIYLFARNTKGSANNYMKGKIFYFEYDDGVQHRQLIPVLDNNMKPAMYDKVSGRLFYNKGTGEFLYGRQILPVEYIESDGTQYIDTGMIPTMKTKVKCGFTYTGGGFGDEYIFGERNDTGNTRFWFGRTDYLLRCAVGNFQSSTIPVVTSTYYDFEIKIEDNVIASVNGLSYESTLTKFTPTRTAFLFAANNQGSATFNSIGRIKYCKIIDNEVLVRDLIPAVDENDVFFMFDNVTHTIYDNAGTGSFVGPTVAKDEQGKIVEPEYE